MDALPALDFTPAVGDHAFSASQRSLLTLAHRLGRDQFAPRAAGRRSTLGRDLDHVLQVRPEIGRAHV